MLTAALVIAGWLAVYLGLRYTLKHSAEKLRREFQDQIGVVHTKMRLLERAVAARPAVVSAAPLPPDRSRLSDATRIAPLAWPTPALGAFASEEVPAETMALITETISGFLGRKVRIRSVKHVPTPPETLPHTTSDGAEPWAQQGRVLVQASHESVNSRGLVAPAAPAERAVGGVVFENSRLD